MIEIIRGDDIAQIWVEAAGQIAPWVERQDRHDRTSPTLASFVLGEVKDPDGGFEFVPSNWERSP